jgi:hypothetical protein
VFSSRLPGRDRELYLPDFFLPAMHPSGRPAIMKPPAPPQRRRSLRGFIEGLGPYQSLVLLALPTSLVEPLKLIAVVVLGKGHWITGSFMIVGAYAASLLLVERLFRIVKPKLLTLPWFARIWSCFIVVRRRVIGA